MCGAIAGRLNFIAPREPHFPELLSNQTSAGLSLALMGITVLIAG
jgi:hypothetical protein